MSSMPPIFRDEVIVYRRQAALGEVRLARNLPGLWVAAATFVLIVGALAILLVGQVARKSTVQGQLVPVDGLGTVVAPIDGVLASIAVEEGEAVERGDVVAIVVAQQQLASGSALDSLESSLEARRAHVAEQDALRHTIANRQREGLESRIAALREEIALGVRELANARQRAALARDALDRLQRLEGAGHVSSLQRIAQQDALLAQQSAAEQSERQISQSRRDLSQLEQELAELPARTEADHAQLQSELARLAQESIALRTGGERVLRAPFAGVVSALRFRAGQPVTANQLVMTLLPRDARLQAQLFVPSRAIGFVTEGDRVNLRYHAFPYQKFGHQAGRVVAVSRSALSPAEMEAGFGPAGSERYYRVLVRLDAQSIPTREQPETLRPGMLMDADILLERRRLFEWLFEPLYAARARLADDTR